MYVGGGSDTLVPRTLRCGNPAIIHLFLLLGLLFLSFPLSHRHIKGYEWVVS